jgi:two-component system, OmpR family, response regulator
MNRVPTPHILLVDDDPALREMLQEYLASHQLRVTTVASGSEMTHQIDREAIDLVLLDLRLPGEDGLELARELRERGNLPIVLLTGRAEEADRVMGLELGADDYVTKPFSPRELLARIRAVLRRYQVAATLPERDGTRRAFRFDGWEFNLRTRRLVSPVGASIELSNGEFSLLVALCGAAGRVLSREQLLSLSRLHDAEVYDRSIDVQILRLRRKIEADPARPELIRTQRGAGYLFDASVQTLY